MFLGVSHAPHPRGGSSLYATFIGALPTPIQFDLALLNNSKQIPHDNVRRDVFIDFGTPHLRPYGLT